MVEEDENPVVESYDAADPKAVKERSKRTKSREKKRIEVVQAIMAQPQGRAFMYDYLTKCSVFTTPFVAGQPDVSDFNSGKQYIGHLLLEDVMVASPDMYWKMVLESKNQ